MTDEPADIGVPPAASADDAALAIAERVVGELLTQMRLTANIEVGWGEPDPDGGPPPLTCNLTGDDLSLLLGRRGETLRALQDVARLIVAKELSHGINLLIDVEGHRKRREEQLRRMARKMAEQAAQRGRVMPLEPMPPDERRIIHLELRDHPDVRTESVGEGTRRKVTIIPK